MRSALLTLLRLLPRNALSRLAGRVAEWRLPRALRAPALTLFARSVGADLSEVRDPLDSFTSIQAFFVRALREGVRPLDPDPLAVVSPCDGAWGASGRVEQGTLLQIKGRPYSLAALLGDDEVARRFEGGDYATLYLSPRDYHRFHAPCAVRVRRARYLPGSLWPVNAIGLEGVDGLFAENERIVAELSVAGDPVDLCAVPVGATMVGRIRLAFDDLTTNAAGRPPASVLRAYPDPGVALAAGEEWGRFEFGSTIVLVAAPGALTLEPRPAGTPVRLGERIGWLARPAP